MLMRAAALHDTCEQDDDSIEGFGWTAYDTRFGGTQTIHDSQGHVDITTDFVKTKDGNSWGIQVRGSLRPDAPSSVKTAIVFHVAHEKTEGDSGKSLRCMGSGTKVGAARDDVDIACYGYDPALGDFKFNVIGASSNGVVEGPVVAATGVPERSIWKAKYDLRRSFYGENIARSIDSFQPDFQANVDKVFPRTAPFDDEEHASFSRALLSNLLGGLGFFHGDSKVDYTNATEYLEIDLNFWEKASEAMKHATITTTGPMSLLSHIPSRPVFPRGFLWDEGFHLLPVVEWDLDLAISVLQSWLNLMDDDGWMAREQILGPEARSRVPGGFQVQYPQHANPPTLLLLFPIILSKLNKANAYVGHPSEYRSSTGAETATGTGDKARAMLRELYPRLSRHYQWFRRTQSGNFTTTDANAYYYPRPEGAIPDAGFRWRGRTPMHTFASGLDDYPRADPPHPGELHVDALAWVGASAQALQQVAAYLGGDFDGDAAVYAEHLAAARHNLDVVHWDPEQEAYCDTTIVGGGGDGDGDGDGDGYGEFQRVCHLG
ncbi:hypothetical protein SLS62_006069 [Diatrype stigma]|uniref:Mannosyl-oligosaccharide glucosidase n=1 Tax=Diatrype stigma TaxID=117547 RepID=A0AAN9YPA6_9PEZI